MQAPSMATRQAACPLDGRLSLAGSIAPLPVERVSSKGLLLQPTGASLAQVGALGSGRGGDQSRTRDSEKRAFEGWVELVARCLGISGSGHGKAVHPHPHSRCPHSHSSARFHRAARQETRGRPRRISNRMFSRPASNHLSRRRALFWKAVWLGGGPWRKGSNGPLSMAAGSTRDGTSLHHRLARSMCFARRRKPMRIGRSRCMLQRLLVHHQ